MFLNEWMSEEDVARDFEINVDDINGIILFANYHRDGYDGSAFVLYRGGDGLYYEVNGSHCSCYGLEGQWQPEETDLESLYHRYSKGSGYMDHGERAALLQLIVERQHQ